MLPEMTSSVEANLGLQLGLMTQFIDVHVSSMPTNDQPKEIKITRFGHGMRLMMSWSEVGNVSVEFNSNGRTRCSYSCAGKDAAHIVAISEDVYTFFFQYMCNDFP